MLRNLKTMTFVAMPMLLAACGSSDEDYLVESCVKEGTDRSTCECQVGVLREKVPEEQLAIMVDMAKLEASDDMTEQEAQAKLMEKYDMGQLMAMGLATMGAMMEAQTKCQ